MLPHATDTPGSGHGDGEASPLGEGLGSVGEGLGDGLGEGDGLGDGEGDGLGSGKSQMRTKDPSAAWVFPRGSCLVTSPGLLHAGLLKFPTTRTRKPLPLNSDVAELLD
jgi:hypothetical protein